MTVVTRFAPSPTGYLHIGGARTALFNYLYARRMGGQFLLRIEDTDKERNTPEAVQAIYGGMAWLGLAHDGDVVLQSTRMARHKEVAYELLARGAAYWDENDQRDMAGPPLRIRGIKGEQTIEDLVQGTVKWPQDIDDFVILRSDGTPTYMLAVVVDDYDMGITHVIRGDDHLNNAFRQNSIYRAMGWDLPTYAHIPLIFDESGKKLSKRTGAAAVEDYRDELGILPEAMVNYLSRLGWGHGDEEIFSMEQAIEWFDIKDVKRNPARLDKKKLTNINGHYIREASVSRLAKLIRPKLESKGITPDPLVLQGVIAALQVRSADLNAMADGTMFLWAKRPLALETPLSDDDRALVSTIIDLLQVLDWQDISVIEGAFHQLSSDTNVKLGKIMAPLRMALTGSKISPPITDVLKLLGKDESLARMKDATNG